MKQTRRILTIYTFALFAATLGVILLRCLDLFFFFDQDIGYYSSDAILPLVETVLLWVVPLALCTLSIGWLRHLPIRYEPSVSPSLRICGILASLCSLGYAVSSFLAPAENTSVLGRLLFVTSLIAAVYFFLTTTRRASLLTPRILTGMGLSLFLLFSLAVSYFDVTVPMNAPDKLIFLIACLSAMLFTVEELRAWLGIPKSGRYFFSLGCAVFFLGVSSVPTMLAISFGIVRMSFWHLSYVLLLGFFVYAVIRMLNLWGISAFLKADDAPSAEPSDLPNQNPSIQ